jgi:hypothetical protein
MAWIYLAESEDSQSPWLPGCSQSLIVKTTDTLPLSYFLVWQAETYQQRQSGTMCGHSLETCSQARSISSTGDSHARTLAAQDLEKAWKASEPDYSVKQLDLYENVNLSSYSSKMSKESKNLCIPFGASLRRLGTIAGTDSYQRQKWEQRIKETVGGYLPTPTSIDSQSCTRVNTSSGRNAKPRPILSTMAHKNLWPTPRATDGSKGTRTQQGAARELERTKGLGDLSCRVGGTLNPTWVEWLMGYPLEHTALEDWAMQWFRSKQEKLLKD